MTVLKHRRKGAERHEIFDALFSRGVIFNKGVGKEKKQCLSASLRKGIEKKAKKRVNEVNF
jgi:hypothetical protein